MAKIEIHILSNSYVVSRSHKHANEPSAFSFDSVDEVIGHIKAELNAQELLKLEQAHLNLRIEE